MTKHECHARDCKRTVPERMLMCSKHWRMVPQHEQDEVWRTYRPGQEITKTPSREYLIAAKNAINVVAEKEGKPVLPTLEDMAPTGLRDFG